jgi:hypothetical protein
VVGELLAVTLRAATEACATEVVDQSLDAAKGLASELDTLSVANTVSATADFVTVVAVAATGFAAETSIAEACTLAGAAAATFDASGAAD